MSSVDGRYAFWVIWANFHRPPTYSEAFCVSRENRLYWHKSHRADRRALPIADRHYNRQKPGTPQFVPPGRCLVLLSEDARAVWVTSWPFAQWVKHAWAGAWINSLFRNESDRLSSTLILEAIAATRYYWPDVPELGLITFVDASKIQSTNPGYCYLCARFQRVGHTKGGLVALQMLPDAMPEPEPPIGIQLRF